MKILIIASQVGNTAPGIVFERLLNGLSQYYDLDVITSYFSSDIDLSGLNNVSVVPIRYKNPRVERAMIRLLKMNLYDIIWAEKVKKKCDSKYDLILSFASSHNLYSLIAGSRIAAIHKIKHYTYFVDAIPAPNGWIAEKGYFRGVKKIIKKYLSQVDGFFASNQKMLDYQLTTFNHKNRLKTGVIYNPCDRTDTKFYENGIKSKNTFLFTGGIYGLRTPDHVIKAFKQLLIEYPNSNLVFVGTNLSETFLTNCTESEREKILILPYTKDLNVFYKEATALIDIDANIDNDVFLSSKITNYLFVNRIIISVTGKNSPSREIFRNIPSIIQTRHDVQEIFYAMKKAINSFNNMEFSDRKKVQEQFSLVRVVDSIRYNIDNISNE